MNIFQLLVMEQTYFQLSNSIQCFNVFQCVSVFNFVTSVFHNFQGAILSQKYKHLLAGQFTINISTLLLVKQHTKIFFHKCLILKDKTLIPQ